MLRFLLRVRHKRIMTVWFCFCIVRSADANVQTRALRFAHASRLSRLFIARHLVVRSARFSRQRSSPWTPRSPWGSVLENTRSSQTCWNWHYCQSAFIASPNTQTSTFTSSLHARKRKHARIQFYSQNGFAFSHRGLCHAFCNQYHFDFKWWLAYYHYRSDRQEGLRCTL